MRKRLDITSYLELIRDELRTIEQLIINYLEFARLEAKEYKLTPSPFDIAEAINKQIENIKILAEEKNINIVTKFPVKHYTTRQC